MRALPSAADTMAASLSSLSSASAASTRCAYAAYVMSNCVTVLTDGMPKSTDSPRAAKTASAASRPTARITASTFSTGCGCSGVRPSRRTFLKPSRWMRRSAQISTKASPWRPSFSKMRARRRRTFACMQFASSTTVQSSNEASKSAQRSRHADRLLYSAMRCAASPACLSASSIARENHSAASAYFGGVALKSSKACCFATLNSALTSSTSGDFAAAAAGFSASVGAAGAPAGSSSMTSISSSSRRFFV
mmetsp:Transcript_15364/g.51738  ORF Transcript_15364/g.51738 Transcript_15364/m.51738 type:complete len:250 (-) Transcript_15364:95-844(-)